MCRSDTPRWSRGVEIDGNRIHNFGSAGRIYDQGIYIDLADGTLVHHNYIYDNAGGYGIQLWTSSQRGHIYNNTIDGNGAGSIIIAGQIVGATRPSSYNEIDHNILSNPVPARTPASSGAATRPAPQTPASETRSMTTSPGRDGSIQAPPMARMPASRTRATPASTRSTSIAQPRTSPFVRVVSPPDSVRTGLFPSLLPSSLLRRIQPRRRFLGRRRRTDAFDDYRHLGWLTDFVCLLMATMRQNGIRLRGALGHLSLRLRRFNGGCRLHRPRQGDSNVARRSNNCSVSGDGCCRGSSLAVVATSSISEGAILSGTVRWTATAPAGTTSVEFWVDGVRLAVRRSGHLRLRPPHHELPERVTYRRDRVDRRRRCPSSGISRNERGLPEPEPSPKR